MRNSVIEAGDGGSVVRLSEVTKRYGKVVAVAVEANEPGVDA
jgi:hypothetical protein